MSMTKHTPGPWTYKIMPIEPYHRVPEISIYNADGQDFIRQSYDTYSDQATLLEGDACLIAAAPEMLEALEALLDFVNSIDTIRVMDQKGFLPTCIVNSKSAIAKAKGEQP